MSNIIFLTRVDRCRTGTTQLLPTSNNGIYIGDSKRLLRSSKREILAIVMMNKAYITKKQAVMVSKE